MGKRFYFSIVLLAVLIIVIRLRPHAQPSYESDSSNSVQRQPDFQERNISPEKPLTTQNDVKNKSNAQASSNGTSAKIKVLDEIFASRNDNDPRLDTDFKN